MPVFTLFPVESESKQLFDYRKKLEWYLVLNNRFAGDKSAFLTNSEAQRLYNLFAQRIINGQPLEVIAVASETPEQKKLRERLNNLIGECRISVEQGEYFYRLFLDFAGMKLKDPNVYFEWHEFDPSTEKFFVDISVNNGAFSAKKMKKAPNRSFFARKEWKDRLLSDSDDWFFDCHLSSEKNTMTIGC